ncbi:Rtr1/RPAP2 family protein [Cryptosporidium meleagridis]|uniref:RNA polymerase II subunit B1 CTD phosphatase RPAP2 homolog n=1 Tax=Cryptosporidium meleagridis TaxID=93969 RepID=A0A2P4Z2E1_9CRYT|nr:Rtr1/RPAP2 family protein [Cryptosporidium meleagridis]
MANNSRLFREKLRKELIEKHVKGLENSNLISLKFQERLIDNHGKLDNEVISMIQSFLRPCDLEEISIERSDKSKCGWIQCQVGIPRNSSSDLKSKWALDKRSGHIIERSILSLFCSTNCYYLYLDLSISLSETHPHLRTDALNEIQKWLGLYQNEKQNDKDKALQNEEMKMECEHKKNEEEKQQEKEKHPENEKHQKEENEDTGMVSTLSLSQSKIPTNEAFDKSQMSADKDQKKINLKKVETNKGENIKGHAELSNLLNSIKTFRRTNTQYKFDQLVKHFDYLDIKESEHTGSSESSDSSIKNHKPSSESFQDKDKEVLILKENSVDGKKLDNLEELDDPEYTYQDMMQVLHDISEDDEDYYEDEDEDDENEEKEEEQVDKNEDQKDCSGKKQKKNGIVQDHVLLMTQFYDNLSPEVVVLDLLTSLISEETRGLIKSKCIVEQVKNNEKEESNKENNKKNEFDIIQIDRRNVLKDNISGYITSIEWIFHTKVLVFTIYRILDTFVFPFSLPNLKQSCLELLTFILIDIIMDNEIHFNITNYFKSLQDEMKIKAEQWLLEIRRKYDNKFIDNIKLLFISKD